MRRFSIHTIACLALLLFWTNAPGAYVASAQSPDPMPASASAAPSSRAATPASAPGENVNYDIQIHLMVGSNETNERTALPQGLEGLVRQLRASMPFNNYRIAATFLNRVRDGGSLQVNGIAGSLFTSSPVPSNPTFYEFALSDISANPNSPGQQSVQISKFKFTLRVPLAHTSSSGNDASGTGPVIVYEPTGINTRISLNEGVPTLVGTMTTGRSDESYIVVLTIRSNAGR